ncbi:MAG: thiamine pyrophosphate-dependent enzyme [Candidatus Roizmanbacteria bacterium]|nr:thiamine pyrophosphate-dependent enzyme [Candidatus Roizmanbacteria bacterium]
MSTLQDFTGYKPTWCPGCGNWGIGMALKMAFVEMGMMPSSVMISFGIGCSGNMNDFINAYAMHGLHGRAIATAVGMKLANHKMPVCAVVGDGDCYGEGGNHFLHACRGNHDIKVIIHDNRVYGLTTGQVSPMAEKGQKSKSTPSGIIETPVDPLALAITQGATFVAQTFAGDTKHMVETLKKAFVHTGFAIVNVLQPCVTFEKKNTYAYYMQHVYKLDAAYDPTNKMQALAKAFEIHEEKYPLGVIYQAPRKAYHEEAVADITTPLISQTRFQDFNNLVEEFI